MPYAQCRSCDRTYSVSAKRSKDVVFVCQDCAEKELARMQKRKPRFIYHNGGMARVVANARRTE